MLEIPLRSCVSIVSMCLFVCDLRSARARLPIFSRGAPSVGSITPLLASGVLTCVSFVSMGSYGGVLFALFGWSVGLLSTCARDRDVKMHRQQVRALIARQVGNFLMGLRLGFLLFCVA